MEPPGNLGRTVFDRHMDFLSDGRTGVCPVCGGLSCLGDGGNADFHVHQNENAEVKEYIDNLISECYDVKQISIRKSDDGNK